MGYKRNKALDKYVLLCVGFLILLFLHLFLKMGWGDDVWFSQDMRALREYIPDRYQEWTSRLLIEIVIKLLTASPEWIWRILNILIVLLFVWIVSDLFGIEESGTKQQAEIMFYALIWCVPMNCVKDAGWIATTLNYLWPLTLGLVALRPIKHWVKEERCPVWEYAACPLCMLFAANTEQGAAVLLGSYLLFGVCLLVEKKALSPFYYLMLGLVVFSIVFILTTPGNANRSSQETIRFFEEYESLKVWQKMLMGFIDTGSYYLAAGGAGRKGFIFALLAGILFAGAWQKQVEKHSLPKVFAAFMPFGFVWGIGGVGKYWLMTRGFQRGGRIIGLFGMNRCLPEGGGAVEYCGWIPYSLGEVLLQAGVYLGLLICVAFTIYNLHGRSRETLFELVILGAGLLSRLIMGFSPTIYASGERTMLFCSVAILVVCLRNLQFLWNISAARGIKIVLAGYVMGIIGITVLM